MAGMAATATVFVKSSISASGSTFCPEFRFIAASGKVSFPEFKSILGEKFFYTSNGAFDSSNCSGDR